MKHCRIHAEPHTRRFANSGFTLTELAAIIMVLGLCLLTFSPALTRTRFLSQACQCLNNQRALCVAWQMYAGENRDFLVYASPSGSVSGVYDSYAWTRTAMDYQAANRAEWDATQDIMQSPLWPYLNKADAEKCPADDSYVIASGVVRPRLRSVSMNVYLGGFAPSTGGSLLGTDGGWPSADPYRIYHLTTDLNGAGSPIPAETMVFLDERKDRINLGNFFVDMTGYAGHPDSYGFTSDLPAAYHDGSCNVVFADGHVAPKRWLDPRTTPPMVEQGLVVTNLPSPANPDIAWLQQHATRPK